MSINRALALLIVGGVALGLGTSIQSGTAAATAVALGSLAYASGTGASRRVLAMFAVLAAGAAHGGCARHEALLPPLVAWFERQGAQGDAVVADIDGTLAADALRLDDGARVLIDVIRVRRLGVWEPVSGRIQAFVAGALSADRLAEWRGGRGVRAATILRKPQLFRNPGGRSVRWQLLTRPFQLSGTIKSALLVTVTPGRPWHEAAAAIRMAVRRGAARQFEDQRVRGIVTAVLIGDRAGLDDALQERLQRAGTYHVIAISGGNVALLCAGSFAVLRLLIRSFRRVALAAALVVVAYGWVVGPEPSVFRAVTAAAVYLSCAAAGLKPGPLDVLAVVSIGIVLADALVVCAGGAWLSFGATLGIILGCGGDRGSREDASSRWWWAGLWSVWRATLAAELVLLPVSAWLFMRVGVAGLVLNFVAIPMMTVVQVAGGFAIGVGHWVPSVGTALDTLAALAANAIIDSAALVDRLPWLSWRTPGPSMLALASFYGLAWVWWRRWSRSAPCRAAGACLTAAVLVIAVSPFTFVMRPAEGRLRLTMFDVGQGEAMLLQLPGGFAMLVDAAGRAAHVDLGDRVVTPALWASGVRALDVLAFSHADLDHVGGAPALVREFTPGEIWEGVPVPSDPKRQMLATIAAARSIPWRAVQRGDTLRFGEIGIDVLNPPLPDWERHRVRNNDSLVIRIHYRDVELLLTGDIGADVEADLPIDRFTPIRILKVGHHGSRTSTSDGLLRRYAPHFALISAGAGNPFGHPAPAVLERLRRAGALVFRTDRDGAVTLETDGREVSIRAETGRTWTMRVWRDRV